MGCILLASMGWGRTECAGLVRGLLGIVGKLLLESLLHWDRLETMLFLIKGEGIQALSATPWCQLLKGDGLH